ncbi:MAG TPA: hypothetical protein VF407_07320 [Polyangiaceae bacterium]
MRRLALAASFCLSFFAASFAHASDGPHATSSLSWVRLPGTESCLPAAELSTRVEAKVGRAVFVSPSVADIAIEARAEKSPEGVRIVVQGTARDGDVLGTRELGGKDCKSLEDSLVLVVALMVDRDAKPAATAPPPSPPAVPPPPPPVVTKEVHEIREIHDAPPPSESWKLDAMSAFELAIGRTPNVAPSVSAGILAEPPHFVPIELGVYVVPHDSAEDGAHRVSVSVVAADVGVCPRRPVGTRLRLGACVGARLGSYRAEGDGFVTSSAQTSFLADARVTPRAEIDLVGPLFVFGDAGISFALQRQHVFFADSNGTSATLVDRPLVGADFGLGFGLRILP